MIHKIMSKWNVVLNTHAYSGRETGVYSRDVEEQETVTQPSNAVESCTQVLQGRDGRDGLPGRDGKDVNQELMESKETKESAGTLVHQVLPDLVLPGQPM